MRAWQFLLGFARHHRVTLVVGSPDFPAEDRQSLAHLAPLVEKAIILPWRAGRDWNLVARRVRRHLTSRQRAQPTDWAEPTAAMRSRLVGLKARTFARVHVFRLYMLPVALEILGGNDKEITQLDLDDWESRTRRQIAALPLHANRSSARRRLAEVEAYAAIEDVWLPRLSRVVVSSVDDRNDLFARYRMTNFFAIPNGIRIEASASPPRENCEPCFLFVGSLGYEPNVDGLGFFITEILPKLRRIRPDLKILVAGGGASWRLRRQLGATPGVWWQGAVQNIDDCYRRATAAIVPLRAGGGTRLKVLEAFAKARPVVSTSTGVAGLGVEPGIHFLRADSAEEWIAGCLSLLRDFDLRHRLVVAASDWVRGYSLEQATEWVATLLDGPHG